MRPNFCPLRGFVIFLSFILFVSFALAVEKKRKPAEAEASSKSKNKPSQKSDPKQQAKSRERDNGKKEMLAKQELARKSKGRATQDQDKKRGKDVSRTAAKSREEKADNRQRAKTAKSEREKKADKTTDKTAKRESNKTTQKAERTALIAKNQRGEIATKSSKSDTELVAGKGKQSSKLTKQEIQREVTENKSSKRETQAEKSVAKLEHKSKSDLKVDPRFLAKEEKARELPAVKFTLRSITKVVPKVELKFSVARAVAGMSYDAPPPQELGPDVIDVIEHDSPESQRLDDVLRSEMKTLQFSSVPSNSRKKIDIGKMDTERIRQLQEALAKKGYYSGEIHGQYDEATLEAMRKFQETNKIDVTGYATAQSLKLLGLTDWE